MQAGVRFTQNVNQTQRPILYITRKVMFYLSVRDTKVVHTLGPWVQWDLSWQESAMILHYYTVHLVHAAKNS